MKTSIKIDIISDAVCPWCYIGKRRLEKAMESMKDDYEFTIDYHPFELNPYLPKDGVDQKAYLADKFGGQVRYEQITQNVKSVAAQEGLNFDFENQHKLPNTFDIHRVVEFGRQQNLQVDLIEKYFKAYFESGVDLSKQENLISIGVSAGLDKEKLTKLLQSEEGVKELTNTLNQIRNMGVSGVPFFIINDKYSVSGAQPAEVFIEALTNISAEMTPRDGEACDIDDPNC